MPLNNHFVVAHINDRCQPMDRGAIYEDPLNEVLQSAGVGSVVGGGSQLAPNMEIACCDVQISLNSEGTSAIDLIVETLNAMGAPKGSKLIILSSGENIPFGLNEGMALYFDNNLPAEVYEQNDINDLIEQFHEALDGNGYMHSASHNSVETRAYFYGPSFAGMKSALSGFFNTHPLCQGLRIEQCA